VVNGARGELEPVMALCCLLRERGYIAHIFTNVNLVPLCDELNLDVTPCFADSEAVLQEVGGVGMNFTKFCRDTHVAAMKWLKKNESEVCKLEEALDTFAPDAIMQVNCAGQALQYERAKGVPVMSTCTCFNQMKYSEAMVAVEPARPFFFPVSKHYQSRDLVPSNQIHITGAWTMNAKDASQRTSHLPKSSSPLSIFISRGTPPIAFTFGSLVIHEFPASKMLLLALRTLKETGRRGVLIGGWMKLDEMYRKFVREGASCMDEECPDAKELLQIAKRQVFAVPEVPHSWLFPKCSCVVHFGNSGTLQAAYEADCPQVILHLSGYPSRANLVPGMPPCQGVRRPLFTMQPEDLVSAIEGSIKYEQSLKKAGDLIRKETGTEDACQIIEAFLIKEVKTGEWKAKFNKQKGAKCNLHINKMPAPHVPCATVKVH